MSGLGRNGRASVFTAALALVTAAAVREAEHGDSECTGEHCETCLRIESAKKLVSGICRGTLFRFFQARCAAPLFMPAALCSAAPQTLVSLKVKSLT